MHRILLDENVPAALRHLIGEHEVRPAYEMGWSGLANGELLAAAEADGFAILITADRNIRYQQNLTNRRIALVVLTTNIWPIIRANHAPILAAIDTVPPGGYVVVTLDRPIRRRQSDRPTL
jgi:hypothetical protein